jgi:hypothetical protein
MDTPPFESTMRDGPLPPKDYSAAYVEELVNQLSNAESQIQWHLDLSRELLTKIRTQIAPH